jgi:hypothetical protein
MHELLVNPSADEEAFAVIAGLGGTSRTMPPGWPIVAASRMELLAFEHCWIAALASQNL